MPDPSVLSARGQQWLASLPPGLRRSYDYLAVINALSKEMDRLEDCVEQVRLEFNPATATLLLNAWEYTVRLPVGGAGATVSTRRRRVIARLRKLLGQSEGREWEQQITGIIGQGWSYQEHVDGDLSSPAPGVLRITLPFQTGTSRFAEALVQIREVTPATLELEFSSAAGFQLDVSELDLTEFGF